MLKLYRHGLNRSVEDARVIDVVPSVEKLVRAFETLELILPELAGIFIQKVHEG